MNVFEQLRGIRDKIIQDSALKQRIIEEIVVPLNDNAIDCLNFIQQICSLLREKIGDRGGSCTPGNGKGGKPPKEHLDMICWEEGWRWVIGIKIPQSLQEAQDLRATQGGKELHRDKDGFRLVNLIEKVQLYGKGKQYDINPASEELLVFKLIGQHKEGKAVRAPSSGTFLVVVRKSWNRDEERAGPSCYKPQDISIAGYKAHFFELSSDRASNIAFIDEQGKPRIHLRQKLFELRGNKLEEESCYGGPLFGDELPKLGTHNVQVWKHIKSIVVIEEGKGSGRTHWELDPIRTCEEQQLSKEIARKGAGWFSIRIYDYSGKLVESMDFRFIKGLRNIECEGASSLPLEQGHNPVTIRFIHNQECSIEPHNQLLAKGMERTAKGTEILIPPTRELDRTKWIAKSNGNEIWISLLLGRVWWAVSNEDEEPRRWEDKPVKLTPQSFRATSKQVLWVLLPKPRWVSNVWAFPEGGYEWRKFEPYVNKSTLEIPLWEFGAELEPDNESKLAIQINDEQAFPIEVVPKFVCKRCKREIGEETLRNHVEAHAAEVIDEHYSLKQRRSVKVLILSPPLPLPKAKILDFCLKNSLATSLMKDSLRQ